MVKLNPIKESTRYTDAYDCTKRAIEEFSRISPHIPDVMKKITQNIYGRFDTAAYSLYRAANSPDINEKIEFLTLAQQELFFQLSSFETIVCGRGLTVGAANLVLDRIKEAHENTARWLNSLKQQM